MFDKRKLAVAFGVVFGLGMVGQASASVYAVSYLNIDKLIVDPKNADGSFPSGGPGLYTFDLDKNAALNGVQDPAAGNALCFGQFSVFTTCGSFPAIVLDSAVQNAPNSVPARAQAGYGVFGKATEYSNANNIIRDATLTGAPSGTAVESISNSNLLTGANAQASSNLGSNTSLNIAFAGGTGGKLIISFEADLYMETEVAVPPGQFGIAQAGSGATFQLQLGGATLVSWAPNGASAVTTCNTVVNPSLVCSVKDDELSLNNTSSSNGVANILSGTDKKFKIEISGLVSGDYTLALNSTTSTSVVRVPVPGSLLLVGTGLLLGARAARRKK